MNPASWDAVRRVFLEALDLPLAERPRFLAAACSGQPAVLDEVQALLRSAGSCGSGITDSAPELLAATLQDCIAEGLPSFAVGAYELRRVIARGGQGAVYEALHRPTRRIVALKMLRGGLRSDPAVRRFRAEAEILAQLRHPGIAQVFDAGTHQIESGGQAVELPYFAMEFIEGATDLREYCDRMALDLPQRIDLFLQVCQAVEYGHQRGVVHRDLKPGNLLVSRDGQPKVIDFGIARREDGLVAAGCITQTGQMLGTPQYMSPEQLQSTRPVADARSDVYALGVILYELLAQRPPLVLQGPVHQVARTLIEETPQPPSAHVRAVPRDLDWIVLRSLEKDPAQRYPSVAAFADDLGRFLRDETIVAGPPSRLQRLVKFARRHRLLVSVSLVVLLALGTGTVLMALGLQRATRSEEEAEREARRARAMQEFMSGMLTAAHPQRFGPDVRVRDVVEQAARTAKGRFPDDPLLQAEVHRTIGATFSELGFLAAAGEHLGLACELRRSQLAEDAWPVQESMLELAVAQRDNGEFGRAEEGLDAAVKDRLRIFGRDDDRTQEALLQQAGLWRLLGRAQDAEAQLREVAEFSLRHHGEAEIRTQERLLRWARALADLGRWQEAEARIERVVRLREQQQGPAHPLTLEARGELARLSMEAGAPERALELRREIHRTLADELGRHHRASLGAAQQVAMAQIVLDQLAEASLLLYEIVALSSDALGPEDPVTIDNMLTLCTVLLRREQYVEARNLSLRALGHAREGFPAGHTLRLRAEETLKLVQSTTLEAARKAPDVQR